MTDWSTTFTCQKFYYKPVYNKVFIQLRSSPSRLFVTVGSSLLEH